MQIEQPEQLAILSAVGGSPIEMFKQCLDDSPNWMISTSGGEQERRNLDLRWLPGAAQAYSVSPDLSDYVVVPVTTVVSSCPNMNGDAILPADLLQYNPEYAKYAYQTFIGKGTYVEHRDNLVLKAAKGLILDAYVTNLDGYKGNRVLLHELLGYDRTKDSNLARAVLKREINSYSIGVRYHAYTCSITGRMFKTSEKSPYTEPFKPTYMMNDGSRRLVYRYLHQLCGVETSAVGTPAFPVAFSNVISDLSRV